MTNIDELYDAEVKQADIDHHTPTAGAMTGHIVANLLYNNVKLHQTLWFMKGPEAIGLKPIYEKLIVQTRRQYDDLAEMLLDENELPPSTIAEYQSYTMITEDGRNKYQKVLEMVDMTVHDYATQDLFIERAVKLAAKENRPVLEQFLIKLLGENHSVIRDLQAILGKKAWDDLIEEDDDD